MSAVEGRNCSLSKGRLVRVYLDVGTCFVVHFWFLCLRHVQCVMLITECGIERVGVTRKVERTIMFMVW